MIDSDRRHQDSRGLERIADLMRLLTTTDKGRVWLLRGMIAAEIIAGVILFALFAPRLEGDWQLFLLLLGLNLVAERIRISIYGETEITIGFVFTVAIIALFGAPGVAISGPLEAYVRRLGRGIFTNKLFMLRNVCRGALVYVISALAYHSVAATGAAETAWQMVAAGALATAVSFSLTAILITVSLSLRTGERLASVWGKQAWLAPHYFALGMVGIALVVAYDAAGYWGIAAFLVPAVMMRFAIKQYVDKTAENVEKLKDQNKALEKANVEIRNVSDELRVTYNATLVSLVSALEARDQETKGHSVRVARYMLNIAEAMGVKRGTQDWMDVQHGALLHDVGKIGVPDAILLKPGKLTAEEWQAMRLHPEIGYNILKDVKFLHGAADIVLAHHEWWDGRGYPYGLKGGDIPLGSRIFSVVDTFDSMTSDRPYRRALSPEEALSEILRCKNSQFDPIVVEAFLDIYEEWVKEHQEIHGGMMVNPVA